jgi:uncharacterized surface protein with fasciclin (FAS1) repeats
MMRIGLLWCILVSFALVVVRGDGESTQRRRRVLYDVDPSVDLQEHRGDQTLVNPHEREALLAENESEFTRWLQFSIVERLPQKHSMKGKGKGQGKGKGKGGSKKGKDMSKGKGKGKGKGGSGKDQGKGKGAGKGKGTDKGKGKGKGKGGGENDEGKGKGGVHQNPGKGKGKGQSSNTVVSGKGKGKGKGQSSYHMVSGKGKGQSKSNHSVISGKGGHSVISGKGDHSVISGKGKGESSFGVITGKGKGKGASQDKIIDFVIKNPNLTSLSRALSRAGLVDTLNSSGPFTVFAPNDGAFGAVPANILNTLLTNDEFIPHLVNLLLYHVLHGELFASDLEDDLILTALNGEDLRITRPPIAVNGNKVLNADNDFSNGVVHIIDGVLVPSWVTRCIRDRVVEDSDLSTLFALLVSAGLTGTLSNPAEITLVAPTNAAFAKLHSDVVDYLTSEAGRSRLVSILLYHVFPGIIVSSELVNRAKIETFQGGFVTTSVGPIKFNDARAVEVDILANNGVVHKIDTVLLPDGGVHQVSGKGKGKGQSSQGVFSGKGGHSVISGKGKTDIFRKGKSKSSKVKKSKKGTMGMMSKRA